MRNKATLLDWRRELAEGLLQGCTLCWPRAGDSAARFTRCEARALPHIAGRRRRYNFSHLCKNTAMRARRRRANNKKSIARSSTVAPPQAKMKLLTLLFAGAAALAPTPAKHIKAAKPAALPYQVAAAATAFAPV